MLLAFTRTTRVLPPGRKDTLLPSVEAVKLFLVCTPEIESAILELAGARMAVAVAGMLLVVLRLATVKLAVVVCPGCRFRV